MGNVMIAAASAMAICMIIAVGCAPVIFAPPSAGITSDADDDATMTA